MIAPKKNSILFSLVLMLFAASPALPIRAAAQGVETLSAGAGKDDRGAHRDFSLRLVFARANGPFVAGVDVTISSQDGKTVLQTHSASPWLFVKLEPGTYHVKARRKTGPATGATVEISPGKQKRVYLTW